MTKLTARKAATLADPGMHSDGGGLYLLVSKTGAKSWILRTMVAGARRDIGLGSLDAVGLAEARESARELRAIARAGGDPVAHRDRDKAADAPARLTFEDAARRVHAEQIVPVARNAKHRDQWINTLRDYAFPIIGPHAVEDVASADVLRVLHPIWLQKPETARRVRQRMRTVFAWARTAGHRQAANPVDDIEQGLPKQREGVRHHAALPYEQLPALFERLASLPGVAALALRFTILTAARTGETLGAQWDEIDLEDALWIIPAERMKARREHRVPLAPAAIDVLRSLRPLAASPGWVFPGQRPGRPLSNMSMMMLLRRIGRGDLTVHGFRSTFRDWCAEMEIPRETAELSLAHDVGTAVERAYRRSDMLDRRRRLLLCWADYCTGRSDAAAPQAAEVEA